MRPGEAGCCDISQRAPVPTGYIEINVAVEHRYIESVPHGRAAVCVGVYVHIQQVWTGQREPAAKQSMSDRAHQVTQLVV